MHNSQSRVKVLNHLDDLPQAGVVYIFGAGKGGSIIYKILSRMPFISVKGFIDNKKEGYLHNIPIKKMKEIENEGGAINIIIASSYVDEIIKGIDNSQDFKLFNSYPIIEQHISRKNKMNKILFSIFIFVFIFYNNIILKIKGN